MPPPHHYWGPIPFHLQLACVFAIHILYLAHKFKEDKQDTPSAMHVSLYSIIALCLSGSVLASPSKGAEFYKTTKLL